MSESQLFEKLRDKPALRLAVARTDDEHLAALKQYRREYYPDHDEDGSLIRTCDTRDELIRLLAEL